MPPDTEMVPISRARLANHQLVDEMVFSSLIPCEWMDAAGITPMESEWKCRCRDCPISRGQARRTKTSIWDQASVLVQIGLIDAGTLPVAGVETARKSSEQMPRMLYCVALIKHTRY